MKKAFAFGDRSLEPAVSRINEIQSVAVIGAGTMGQGIIIDLLTKTDYRIIVLDVSDDALAAAGARFEKQRKNDVAASRLRQEDADALASRLTFTTDYTAIADTDIVWEVATEAQ